MRLRRVIDPEVEVDLLRRALGPVGRLMVGCQLYANAWPTVHQFWGRGYASEIGRAGLEFAFDVLGAQDVVSCTVRHNVRSRAVMERIGMRYAGEIHSRGTVEGEQDDAPFAVCIRLRPRLSAMRTMTR